MVSVAAMLLADSRFPAGSYAHSLGLEQAVAEGLSVDDVAPFMEARLRLVARPDAALSVAARRAVASAGRHAFADGEPPRATHADLDGVLANLDAEHAARCPSPVLRDVARRLGSQLLRSAATAWPSPTIDGYRSESQTTPRPVALGVVGSVAGLSDVEVAMVALYDDAATVASAALKLLGLDPAVTARWLAELAPQIGAMAGALADDDRPIARQPPPAAVAIELAATRHAQRTERLFVS